MPKQIKRWLKSPIIPNDRDNTLQPQILYELLADINTNVWELNIQTGKVYTNAHSGRLGYSEAEYPKDAEAWQALIHPEDLPIHLDALQAHLTGQTPDFSVEHRVFQKDGSLRWLLTRGRAQRDAQGNPIKIVGTSTDITERKLMEKQIQRERDNFLKMFAAAPVGLLLLNQETKIIQANRSVLEITQGDSIEIIGKRVGDGLRCTHGLENPRGCGFSEECSTCTLRQEIEKSLAGGQSTHDIEIEQTLLIDGHLQPRCLKIGAEPLELDGQRCVIVAIDDITERKKAEEREREQRILAESLSDSAAALNSTLDFDEVLDHILDNVGRIVPHDSAGIILLDATRQFGFATAYRDTRDQATDMKGTQFLVSQTRTLREMKMTGEPVIIADTSTYDEWVITPISTWIRAGLGVPIKIKGEVIGFLFLSSAVPNTFTQRDAERLQAFVNHAAIAIENARLYEEVQKLAITDPLTGIYNRTFFEVELARIEVGRDFPVSIIVADLDNLKTINDAFGHAVGDELIKNAAQILREVFRAADIMARIGGDEFAVLLPHTDTVVAGQMLSRVRAKLTEQNTAHPNLSVQLSLGAATAEQGSLMEAFVVADQRMYAAKATRKLSQEIKD